MMSFWRGTNCGENEAKQKAADLNIMFDPGEICYRVVGTNLPTRALAARSAACWMILTATR
jgi:hypothetical protein